MIWYATETDLEEAVEMLKKLLKSLNFMNDASPISSTDSGTVLPAYLMAAIYTKL